VPLSPGTAVAPDRDAKHTPDEDIRAAASTGGAPGGDAPEMVRAADLGATLLAASTP
jgi:hypothetical protein